NFMIQAGGIASDMQQKPSHPPIKNEADNGLQNKRGTIAMGQKPGDPDSASSHFFINLIDNTHLDYHGPAQPGYTVFGKVIEGMDTVDKIAAAKNTTPDKPVVITSAKRANP
ncbi:MAG: peptidylprolyl isomerase, partial [Planctomycetes bacterium]|nr:peptidylprolyl isomerase [Planctomycetota bacterium]